MLIGVPPALGCGLHPCMPFRHAYLAGQAGRLRCYKPCSPSMVWRAARTAACPLTRRRPLTTWTRSCRWRCGLVQVQGWDGQGVPAKGGKHCSDVQACAWLLAFEYMSIPLTSTATCRCLHAGFCLCCYRCAGCTKYPHSQPAHHAGAGWRPGGAARQQRALLSPEPLGLQPPRIHHACGGRRRCLGAAQLVCPDASDQRYVRCCVGACGGPCRG